MWLMLQKDNFAEVDDYVLSTNEYHSVREFVEKAFLLKGIRIGWMGEGLNEVGYDLETKRVYIFISEKYFRPAEVDLLLGNAAKAKEKLGWEPKVQLEEGLHETVRWFTENSERLESSDA